MRVAAHQPNYLPYIGLFQKMSLADVFVIGDDLQLSKPSYSLRTRIKAEDGWRWLTIPIEKKYHRLTIQNVLLLKDDKWFQQHEMAITQNYVKCKYFDKEFINNYYSSNFKSLAEFNMYGISYLKERFNLNCKIVYASDLHIDDTLRTSDYIIEIMKKVGGDTYLSGSGGSARRRARWMTCPCREAVRL